MAPNLSNTPPAPPGVEVWLSNWHRGYLRRLPRALIEWTRYFNMHSKQHMLKTYPAGFKWYEDQDGTRPIYLRDAVEPTIKGSTVFPRHELQTYFSTNGTPQRYFTCSACWFIALAIYEKFERIELWGFEVRTTKKKYAFERPCIFYWIEEARKRGIEVWTPPELILDPYTIGDPDTYDGPLYGYETTEPFIH